MLDMDCIICLGKTKVIDTSPKGTLVYRQRRCLKCGVKFTTRERVTGYPFPRRQRNVLADSL